MMFFIWLFGVIILFTIAFLLRVYLFAFKLSTIIKGQVGVLRIKGHVSKEEQNRIRKDWNEHQAHIPMYMITNANDSDLKFFDTIRGMQIKNTNKFINEDRA